MKVIGRVIAGLVLLAAVFAGVGFLLPGAVHVERSTVIAAQPARIFPHLNDLRKANAWSPWAARDPATVFTFSGPDQGVGAAMAWESHKNGTGRQQIIASQPDETVASTLEFGGMGGAQARFTLVPEAAATRVTWAVDMALPLQPFARWFGLVFPWLIGGDFDEGLARLKRLVETGAA